MNKLKRNLRSTTSNHELSYKRMRDKIAKLENDNLQANNDN